MAVLLSFVQWEVARRCEEATAVGLVDVDLLGDDAPMTANTPTMTRTSTNSPAYPRQPMSA